MITKITVMLWFILELSKVQASGVYLTPLKLKILTPSIILILIFDLKIHIYDLNFIHNFYINLNKRTRVATSV